MTSTYDFGKDELGIALNEHVRVTHPFPRVWLIQPYGEIYSRLHKDPKPRGARTNTHLIIQAMRIMASRGDIQTVIWDGFTNTAKSCKNEVAHSGVNKDESTKNMVTQWSDSKESILNLPGMNWRDYGMVQEFMRYDFRNQILASPEPFHFLCVGHEVLNEPEGEYGPDIGGPKGWNFAGGVFEGVFWVGKKGQKRLLAYEDLPRGAYKCKATLKKSPDLIIGEGSGYIEIPDTYQGSVELIQELRAAQNSPLSRWLIYGGFDGGKTALSSAFMGTEGSGNALVVMADQQLGLPTWWPETKTKQKETK